MYFTYFVVMIVGECVCMVGWSNPTLETIIDMIYLAAVMNDYMKSNVFIRATMYRLSSTSCT